MLKEYTIDRSPDSDRAYDAMMQATKGSVKYIRCRKKCDLLVALKKSGLSTNDVEDGVEKTCKMLTEKQRHEVKMKLTRQQIADAYRKLEEVQRKKAALWKQCKQVVTGEVRIRYLNKWREYTKRTKTRLVKENRKKLEWIQRKRSERNDNRGIEVGDEEFSEEFKSEPRLYGRVQVNEDELAVLTLPPKFGLYRKLDPVKCKIDVEESINKLRWRRIIDKRREGEEESMERSEFVNIASKKIDVGKLQPRSLPFNPSVAMPKALSMEEEVKISQVKIEIEKIVRSMVGKCKQYSNLTESERRGLESLKERVTVGEIVCTVTDKSGRWSVDTSENYKKGCQKLVADEEKTPEITREEHEEAEREMNSHALALVRMLGLSDGDSGKRLRNAITAEGTSIAPLYGLRKDHKPIPEDTVLQEEGPKMRPICGARDSLTKRTSYLLCKILTPLLEGEETHCSSTDDLIEKFKELNKSEVKEDWKVGSLDVESLYPSLNIEKCVGVIKEKLFGCDMDFENLRWKEIALYLKYNDETNIEFQQYLPRRRFNRRPPKFTRSGSMNNQKIRHSPWIFPTQTPDERTTKKMFCEAVGIMIEKTMHLHDFQIDGVIYRQREGGAIGMDLTGVVSDIYMCEWDKDVQTKLRGEQMEPLLYKRYKDDVNMVLETHGENQSLTCKETMLEVKRIADTVDNNLKVTTDCTEDHDNKKVPILDLNVWIGKNENGTAKVLYDHFMKSVAS